MTASSFSFGVALVAALVSSRVAAGQCELQWQPGDPIPTVRGDTNTSAVWDPDGAGPAPAVLVVGGKFGVGAMLSTSLASFDGANWGSLGASFDEVTALTVWNGLLVAAGGAGTQHSVASWNGTAWSVLGVTNGPVNAFAIFNGDLFAGGSFSVLNGVTMRSLSRWNGATWSEPAGGVVGEVRALTVFGALWVGGSITQAGAVAVNHLAIWNGTSWSAGATFNAAIRSLAARNGTTAATSFVFAGGDFTAVAGVAAQHVARFSASTNAWSAIPGLPGVSCHVVHVRSTGLATFQLHAAIDDQGTGHTVYRLNGSAWQTLGNVFDDVEPIPTSIAFFNGQYVVTFESKLPPLPLGQAVRIHDGTAWQAATGPGFDGSIWAVMPSGSEMIVAGDFEHYGTTSLTCIARGLPGAWLPLGSGVTSGHVVRALCKLPNGDVVAGGDFSSMGGVPANNIARWNGSSWLPLGLGVTGSVYGLLATPEGHVIAAGGFTDAGGLPASNIARWNGFAWSPLGAGANDTVVGLARLGNGDVIATGVFLAAGGAPASRIARWNGTSWSPLGTGLNDIGVALAVLADDTLVVGGFFTAAGGVLSPSVARWDGSAWVDQSTTLASWDDAVYSVVALPNGDYIAGGFPSHFGPGGPSGGADANLARHSGGLGSLQWNAFDLLGSEVRTAALMPNGDLAFGGGFDGAGGFASRNLALLRPTCPATTVAYGIGCLGSGGTNVLEATALPWTGGTFRGRATGMPAVAITLSVWGFAQIAVPMPLVLPQGVVGCTAFVSPDHIDLALPVAGTVSTQLALPPSVSLAGQSCHHQVVPLELDLAGNIIAVTSTNGLTLTIGVL